MSNVLTCVYCGHQYPEGTPPHGAKVLTDHIKVCEKHPMRELEVENAHLKELLLRRTNEQELLSDIFGREYWKGKYSLWWCELCDTFSIGCTNPKCHGSSCNAGGCPECIPVHEDFHEAKTHIWQYLSEDERKTYEKIQWLKKYMKESLSLSEYEINWKRMKQQGHLCEASQEIFAKEIADSFAAQPDITFGEY